MFQRLCKPLKSNSFFMFGPRGSGKTTFLEQYFTSESVIRIDLLDPRHEERFAVDPSALSRMIAGNKEKLDWIIIDEVQRAPKLLDLVHQHIERDRIKFALTGSSARKLKGGHANLLAGRAFVYAMHPLTSLEYGSEFSLERALSWGTLPKLSQFTTDEEREVFLRSYTDTYLKEEIAAEQLIRNLTPFRKFLPVAAQSNARIVNFTNIASDIGVDHKTVKNYFEILEDTMMGFFLPAFHESVRKSYRKSPKFYFFDTGVARSIARLTRLPLTPNSSGYGSAFEHFVILEFHRLASYLQPDYRFAYYQTKDENEIDLVIDRPGKRLAVIEIKSTASLLPKHVAKFAKLTHDFADSEAYCLSNDPHPQGFGHVRAMHWQAGIEEILAIGQP